MNQRDIVAATGHVICEEYTVFRKDHGRLKSGIFALVLGVFVTTLMVTLAPWKSTIHESREEDSA